MLARILWHLLRWCFIRSYRKDWDIIFCSNDWHHHISGMLGKYIYWLFWPIAIILKRNNIVISINNISQSTGHLYIEVDNLLRQHAVGIIPREKKIYCIFPKSPVSVLFKKKVDNHGLSFIINGLLNALIYPLALRYKYISCNAGLSAENHGIDANTNKRFEYFETYYLHIQYFQLVSKTSKLFPIKNFYQNEVPFLLMDFIGSKIKYVVIQIKDQPGNATFQAIDPRTYLSAIIWTMQNGYKVIFAGREKMPKCFSEVGVVNYSESKFASALNDYYLIRDATAVLSSGSGFSCIPFTLGIPLLIVNVWNFLWAGHDKTLIIPSLLNLNEKKLKFSEQYNLALNRGQLTINNPYKEYHCISASESDIFNGWVELFIKIDNDHWTSTPLQKKFKTSVLNSPSFYSLANVVNSFLCKNLDRL